MERAGLREEPRTSVGNSAVITFLPYPDFTSSAQCLDDRRLGKQRVEVLWILNALRSGGVDRRVGTDAVQMWAGYTSALAHYGYAVCTEWIRRGFTDNIRDVIYESSRYGGRCSECTDGVPMIERGELDWCHQRVEGTTECFVTMPRWLGMREVHESHRAALLAKDPLHYSQFTWAEKPAVRYFWPV